MCCSGNTINAGGVPPRPPNPLRTSGTLGRMSGTLGEENLMRSASPVFTPLQTSPVLQGQPAQQQVMQFSLNQQGSQQFNMTGMASPSMMASPRSHNSGSQPPGAANPMMATPVMVQSPRGLQQAVIMPPVQVGAMQQQQQMQMASPRLQHSNGGQPPPPLPPQHQNSGNNVQANIHE